MAQVSFDPAEFKTQYTEFASVPDVVLTRCFDQATLYLSNGDSSVVQDLGKRKAMLYLCTAHVAKILKVAQGGAANSTFGVVSSAKQGSVDIQFQALPMTGSKPFFFQTQYGAMFYQAALPFRTMRYIECQTVPL